MQGPIVLGHFHWCERKCTEIQIKRRKNAMWKCAEILLVNDHKYWSCHVLFSQLQSCQPAHIWMHSSQVFCYKATACNEYVFIHSCFENTENLAKRDSKMFHPGIMISYCDLIIGLIIVIVLCLLCIVTLSSGIIFLFLFMCYYFITLSSGCAQGTRH